MDDDVRLRTANGSAFRPLDPQMSYHRGQRGELPVAPGQDETKTAPVATLTYTRGNTKFGVDKNTDNRSLMNSASQFFADHRLYFPPPSTSGEPQGREQDFG